MLNKYLSAFPMQPYNHHGQVGFGEDGMTLRDYFAAKAMQAILGNLAQGIKPQDCIVAAEDAYFVANGMRCTIRAYGY